MKKLGVYLKKSGFFLGVLLIILLSIAYKLTMRLPSPVLNHIKTEGSAFFAANRHEIVLTSGLTITLFCLLLIFLKAAKMRYHSLRRIDKVELEFALNTGKLGFWNLNTDTHQVDCSLLHYQIFGYSSKPQKSTYERFLRHVHPEDYETVDRIVRSGIATKLPWEFECRIYRADDKSLRWIAMTGKALKIGKRNHMLGLVQDITERKQNEDAHAMLSALVKFSNEAIVGKDLNGTIFSWNKAAQHLYGYSESEAVGQCIKILFPEKRKEEFENIIHMIKTDKHIRHKETWRRHKDGHLIPVSITISPIKNSKGEIIGASTTAHDITEQKLFQEKLKHLAEHDALTGLINRAIFEDRMSQALSLAKREKCNMAVCFLDIDNFKLINDNYGHVVGDLLLREAAKRMQSCIRDIDTVGRFGGDEFALILSYIKEEKDVIKVAKKLIDRFSKSFVIEEHHVTVSLSIGLSLYPRDGSTELLEKADAAMYYVKRRGKNNFIFYNEMEEQK
ncbi:MAG: diguanylate cyclase [Tatlockia sp.]